MKSRQSLLIAAILICVQVASVYAQNIGRDVYVRINQIISKNYPELGVYISVFGEDDQPYDFRKEQLRIYIDTNDNVPGIEKNELAKLSESGIAYAVIISANGGNKGRKLYNQQFAVKQLLDQLSPNDTMDIYIHGEEVKPVFQNVKNNEETGKYRAIIDQIEAKGSNPQIYNSIIMAVNELSKPERIKQRKLIIILSDGRDEKSSFTLDEMLNKVDESSIPVYSVGFKSDFGGDLGILESISRHTGGNYLLARSETDIPDIMSLMYRQINAVYYLRLKDNKLLFSGDGKLHSLTVSLDISNTVVHSHTKKFIATRIPVPVWLIIIIIVVFLLIVALIVFLIIINLKNKRRKIGITNRKCKECGRRMKDDWDECLFCKFLPAKKKKKKTDEEPDAGK